MKSKKKMLGVFISNFKTYTRFSGVAEWKAKKKGLRGPLPF